MLWYGVGPGILLGCDNNCPTSAWPEKWAELFCPSHHCSEPPLMSSLTPTYQQSLLLLLITAEDGTYTGKYCILNIDTTYSIFHFYHDEAKKQPWEYGYTEIYPYILQPVCLVNSWMPVEFINGGVNHIFHLSQRLPHDMNVGNFQEV